MNSFNYFFYALKCILLFSHHNIKIGFNLSNLIITFTKWVISNVLTFYFIDHDKGDSCHFIRFKYTAL